MKKILLFMVLSLAFKAKASEPSITYRLSMPNPNTHIYEVSIDIAGNKKNEVLLKMPVWAPGSYLIREFPRHVEGVSAFADNKDLSVVKISKNTWKVNTQKKAAFTFKYKVYAYELSVRTSFLDIEHAYINGTSVFMYVDERMNESLKLNITPYKEFKQISVGLIPNNGDKWAYVIDNYDLLADSPIEIGNQQIFTFQAAGIPHTVGVFGNATVDKDKLSKDITKIVDQCVKIFNTHPCKNYTFIIHSLNEGGGGLEHLNSTTIQVKNSAWTTDEGYKGLLGLVAHEYFHLWNVKCLRPIALGPFDYEKENYTSMLWVAEGFTSYYDNLLLKRAGITSEKEYLNAILTDCQSVTNTIGARVQSVSESSLDAWIKFYRTYENSANATISYYTKGTVLGMLLDIELIDATSGKSKLDDLFRTLYQDFYLKKGRGYTDEEFKTTAEKIAGKSLDPFFNKCVNGTDSLNYNEWFNKVGIQINQANSQTTESYFGANISATGVILGIMHNSPAEKAGFYVNDQIISVNQMQMKDFSGLLKGKPIGYQAKVNVFRSGEIREFIAILEQTPSIRLAYDKKTNATEAQKSQLNFLIN